MNVANNPLTRTSGDAIRPMRPTARQIGTFGMLLFLASLTMLFVASIIGYVVIRLQLLNAEQGPTPPLGQITLPIWLWLSTFVIVVSSATLHYAGMSIALGHQRAFRRAMGATALLGLCFLVIQAPSLYALVESQQGVAQENMRLYALIVALVILHGLHVIGGLVPLVVITANAFKGAYDQQSHNPVVHFTLYWHFLDAVWIIMFSVFMFLG